MTFSDARFLVCLAVIVVLAAGGAQWVDVPTGAFGASPQTTSPAPMTAVATARATAVATTVLTSGTIRGHRFVRSFSLADGALRLDPFRGAVPSLSLTQETTMWSTQGIGGAIEGIGFADVTLNRTKTRQLSGPDVSAYFATPALVGLAKSESRDFCALMTPGHYSTYIPISQGWYAVIFPLNPTKSDSVFTAASNVCGKVGASTVATAYETLSVDWHLEWHRPTGAVIVASVPRCGKIVMSGGGGNEFKGLFEYQVESVVLDRPLSTTCSPATNFDEGPNYAGSSTTHGFTGPVLSVGPDAGDVVTSQGVKSQPLD